MPFSVHSLEVQFKQLSLNVPDNELTNILVASSDLLISAKSWDMHFSDTLFESNCKYIKQKLSALNCSEENRLNLLTEITKNNKLIKIFFGTTAENIPLKVQRKSFTKHIMYYALSTNYSTIYLIDKKSGNTIEIKGKFEEKDLDMFVLEKLNKTGG